MAPTTSTMTGYIQIGRPLCRTSSEEPRRGHLNFQAIVVYCTSHTIAGLRSVLSTEPRESSSWEGEMKLRLPWQKAVQASTPEPPTPATCAHPQVEVEMRGTAIKRRWCKVCGQELPVEERWHNQ
jgi:hypothetical protein